MRSIKIVLMILSLAAFASAEKLLLLPMAGDADKAADISTVNQLYRDVVEAQFKGTLLSPPAGVSCNDRECALKVAREARADGVIYSTLNRLGSKWIFSSTIMGVDGNNVFNQRLTALSIEDFEAVTKRMADALLNRKETEQVASLDNITEKENTQEPERRRSLSASGVALGYLWPTNDSLQNQYSQVIRVAWLNDWELRNNFVLGAELIWGVGASIGGDLNLNYVFSRTDISPFVGGGVGLHFYGYDNAADRRSGPTLNMQGGMFLFRTYDVHVRLRGQYQVTFNSDMDQGFILDAGFTFGKMHL